MVGLELAGVCSADAWHARAARCSWRTTALPVMMACSGWACACCSSTERALPAAEEQQARHLEVRIREATAEIERNYHPAGRDCAWRRSPNAGTQAHRRRSARRPGRQAADHRAHQRLRTHLLAGARGARGDAPFGAGVDRQAGASWSTHLATGAPRWYRRLGQAGIEADWQRTRSKTVAADLVRARLRADHAHPARGDQQRHQTQRRATHCSLSCDHRRAATCTSSRCSDDGNGIPMELDGRLDRGHGMASMKHRAKQLQGQCLVESGPGYGTVIRLTLPLEIGLHAAGMTDWASMNLRRLNARTLS